MSEHETHEGFESHRRQEAPAPDAERPDWLVGAEEGAQAERGRDAAPAPPLKLVVPDPDAAKPPGGQKAPPQAWKAAASSVPKLQRVEGTGGATVAPAPRGWAVAPPHAVPAGGRGDAADLEDFPAGGAHATTPAGDDPLAVSATPAALAPPRTVLEEPWWAVAADALQTQRPLQIGILAVALAVVAWFAWPRSQPSVAIRSIHAHPERYDGVTVRVAGRVGDVYEIGGAYAFYLEQGRDTIVVFSRTRRPYRNEKLSVAGSVSMGYLDGIARPSLFEIAE